MRIKYLKYKKKVTSNYNLHTVNPILAKEWHPIKNGDLIPKDIAPHSNITAWWRCKKNHEWKATVNHRSKGPGCPYCSGRLATKNNCLQTANPKLAKQWHSARNGTLKPKHVTPVSGKKVWWLCGKGHEWQATISNRSNGTGCPFCIKK